jgi:short-subunit dehydrogenase
VQAVAADLPSQVRTLCVNDLSSSIDLHKLAIELRKLDIDILINNAGTNEFGSFQALGEEAIDAIVALNLVSPMKLTQALLDHLISREGMVVNVGSAFGFIGYPGNAAYCSSKFGLRGFSEALYRENKDLGLKVIYAAPRAIDTGMNDARVVGMNRELGNIADTPLVVAASIVAQMEGEVHRQVLGFPEKLFAKINGVLPKIVDGALIKKAKIVRAWASRTVDLD